MPLCLKMPRSAHNLTCERALRSRLQSVQHGHECSTVTFMCWQALLQQRTRGLQAGLGKVWDVLSAHLATELITWSCYRRWLPWRVAHPLACQAQLRAIWLRNSAFNAAANARAYGGHALEQLATQAPARGRLGCLARRALG
jgi:hypothetical protein